MVDMCVRSVNSININIFCVLNLKTKKTLRWNEWCIRINLKQNLCIPFCENYANGVGLWKVKFRRRGTVSKKKRIMVELRSLAIHCCVLSGHYPTSYYVVVGAIPHGISPCVGNTKIVVLFLASVSYIFINSSAIQ